MQPPIAPPALKDPLAKLSPRKEAGTMGMPISDICVISLSYSSQSDLKRGASRRAEHSGRQSEGHVVGGRVSGGAGGMAAGMGLGKG